MARRDPGRKPRLRKKILLADNSSVTLMAERMILSDGSYDLLTACDGEEAFEKAVNEVPDLILLDVLMPRMDGFEVCRKLRRTRNAKSIPILMVSTRGEAETRQGETGSGWDGYLTKPIDGIELLAKVRSFLGS